MSIESSFSMRGDSSSSKSNQGKRRGMQFGTSGGVNITYDADGNERDDRTGALSLTSNGIGMIQLRSKDAVTGIQLDPNSSSDMMLQSNLAPYLSHMSSLSDSRKISTFVFKRRDLQYNAASFIEKSLGVKTDNGVFIPFENNPIIPEPLTKFHSNPMFFEEDVTPESEQYALLIQRLNVATPTQQAYGFPFANKMEFDSVVSRLLPTPFMWYQGMELLCKSPVIAKQLTTSFQIRTPYTGDIQQSLEFDCLRLNFRTPDQFKLSSLCNELKTKGKLTFSILASNLTTTFPRLASVIGKSPELGHVIPREIRITNEHSNLPVSFNVFFTTKAFDTRKYLKNPSTKPYENWSSKSFAGNQSGYAGGYVTGSFRDPSYIRNLLYCAPDSQNDPEFSRCITFDHRAAHKEVSLNKLNTYFKDYVVVGSPSKKIEMVIVPIGSPTTIRVESAIAWLCLAHFHRLCENAYENGVREMLEVSQVYKMDGGKPVMDTNSERLYLHFPKTTLLEYLDEYEALYPKGDHIMSLNEIQLVLEPVEKTECLMKLENYQKEVRLKNWKDDIYFNMDVEIFYTPYQTPSVTDMSQRTNY